MATGSQFFPFLEHFDAIAFVNKCQATDVQQELFPSIVKSKNAKKGNIQLLVAIRGSQTSVLKCSINFTWKHR